MGVGLGRPGGSTGWGPRGRRRSRPDGRATEPLGVGAARSCSATAPAGEWRLHGNKGTDIAGKPNDFMPTTNIVHHGSKKMSFTRFDQVIFSGSASNVAIGQSVWCSANRNALIFNSKMRKPKCTSQRQSHMQCSCWPRHRNKILTNSVPLPENWQRASSRACLPIPARCARSARRSPRPQTFGLMHSKQGSRPSRNLPRTSFPLAMALRRQRRES